MCFPLRKSMKSQALSGTSTCNIYASNPHLHCFRIRTPKVPDALIMSIHACTPVHVPVIFIMIKTTPLAFTVTDSVISLSLSLSLSLSRSLSYRNLALYRGQLHSLQIAHKSWQLRQQINFMLPLFKGHHSNVDSQLLGRRGVPFRRASLYTEHLKFWY